MPPPCWSGWDDDPAGFCPAPFPSACWRRWPCWPRRSPLFSFYRRARGAWARGLAFAILLFALAGPLLVHETHAPLPDMVAVIVDRSQSMGVGDRAKQADQALAASTPPLAAQPDLIVREAVRHHHRQRRE